MDQVDDKELEEVDTERKAVVDEKEFEEAAVDTGADVTSRQRSPVYTATEETLFQEAARDTKTHSLVSKQHVACSQQPAACLLTFHISTEPLDLPAVFRMGLWNESHSSCLESTRPAAAGGSVCWRSCWHHLQSHLKLPAYASGIR